MPTRPSLSELLTRLQRYCAYQDRCHLEVRRKLLDLGARGDEVEEIIAELITDKFLDEERFARSFARGRFRHKQWGRLRITRELQQRQVGDYCIRKAMEEIDPGEYLAALEQLIRKKDEQEKEQDPFLRRQRVAAFAIRRGFEPEQVWEKVKELVGE